MNPHSKHVIQRAISIAEMRLAGLRGDIKWTRDRLHRLMEDEAAVMAEIRACKADIDRADSPEHRKCSPLCFLSQRVARGR